MYLPLSFFLSADLDVNVFLASKKARGMFNLDESAEPPSIERSRFAYV
jgi:hypothetical protein